MPTIIGYGPSAVSVSGGTIVLDPTWDVSQDGLTFDVTDAGSTFDGDASVNEVGDDATQDVVVTDASGSTISSGQAYLEDRTTFTDPSGNTVNLYKVEVAGTHVGWISDGQLTPGVVYTVDSTTNVTANDAPQFSDLEDAAFDPDNANSILGGSGNDLIYAGDSPGTAPADTEVEDGDDLTGTGGADFFTWAPDDSSDSATIRFNDSAGVGDGDGVADVVVVGNTDAAGTLTIGDFDVGTDKIALQESPTGISQSSSPGDVTFTITYSNGNQQSFRILHDNSTSVSSSDVFTTDTPESVLGIGNDEIDTGAGNDTIYAGAGNDSVDGGSGNDFISGGAANDTLYGGSGNDTFQFEDGSGTDTVYGGDGTGDQVDVAGLTAGVTVTFTDSEDGTITDGSNTVTFDNVEEFVLTDQDDTVNGSASSAEMSVAAGAGNDSILGSSDGDLLYGGTGDDEINVGGGADVAYGGEGSDTFGTAFGSNTFYGGDDGDTFGIGFDSDTIFGGEGGTDQDTMDGSVADDALTIVLSADEAGTFSDDDGDSGAFSGIENFVLTSEDDSVDASAASSAVTVSASGGADSITGGSGDDSLHAGAGTDTVYGGAGNDSINAFSQDDLVYGGTGNDSIQAEFGNDTVYAGDGADTVQGFAGDDTIYGEAGEDLLIGENGEDLLYGGDGADLLRGQAGSDTLFGDLGNDSIRGGQQDDTIYGGEGADDIDGQSENDLIYGGDGDDSVVGDTGDDILYGGEGSDTVSGGDGQDLVFGGAGNDDLWGGAGNDTVFGGSGNDTLSAGTGNDTLDGGVGNDTLTGGTGDDVFVIGAGGGDDTITDFGTGNDQLDISGLTDIGNALTNQDGAVTADEVTVTGGGGSDQILTFPSGESVTVPDGTVDTSTPATQFASLVAMGVPPCFAPGTRILTSDGQRAVETLRVGDLIQTADHGVQPLLWIGRRDVVFDEANPRGARDKPVKICAGALGRGLPEQDLVVSPQHRMVLAGPAVAQAFGEVEIFAIAKALTIFPGVRVMQGKRHVTYYALLLPRHEVIFAEGAPTESFRPGPTALAGFDHPDRARIFELYPGLSSDPDVALGEPARPIVRRRDISDAFGPARQRQTAVLSGAVSR